MATLVERDRARVWHPFTQEKIAAPPIAVARAQGSYVYDEQGKAYLDLISSWWVNLHGHARPEIAAAIYEQACCLEHVLFAGFTHEPAVQLAEDLSQLLPANLTRFFYSDNGSTCVEVALKMAVQYWYNRERKIRSLFLSFDGGYHGDTFGAMAVGAQSGYHDGFKALLFKVLSVPFPATWDNDFQVEIKEAEALTVLNQHLQVHGDEIAAIILEPLVQGASGMRMCRPAFVNQVIACVRAHGILVIFDEVMTGFGRTGTYFAVDQLAHTPDLLCISKGITGGFLPLAMTITTDQIYDAFLSDVFEHAFAHGHSYTANPLACAAALVSLKLLTQETTQQAIQKIHLTHQAGLAFLKMQGSQIVNLRCLGTIAAFEIKTAHPSRLNQQLRAAFLQQGLLLRPLGTTLYLIPPYSITATELEDAYCLIAKILHSHADDVVDQANFAVFQSEQF